MESLPQSVSLLTHTGRSNHTSLPGIRNQAEHRTEGVGEPIGGDLQVDRLIKELRERDGCDGTDSIARLAPLACSRDFEGQFSQDQVAALADMPRGNPSSVNQQARMVNLCRSDTKSQNHAPCRRAKCVEHIRYVKRFMHEHATVDGDLPGAVK